eukprot:TRINITY_DN6852_c0_g1_i2.p1 TRINITY_DN6852_c0_g1~~TRINITY_DN6852_c0_g1_i2.p1  ORF type:complete len:353 (-),score=36.46 TRINITY_DN6852_c0_g1_i2:107-1138(-)
MAWMAKMGLSAALLCLAVSTSTRKDDCESVYTSEMVQVRGALQKSTSDLTETNSGGVAPAHFPDGDSPDSAVFMQHFSSTAAFKSDGDAVQVARGAAQKLTSNVTGTDALTVNDSVGKLQKSNFHMTANDLADVTPVNSRDGVAFMQFLASGGSLTAAIDRVGDEILLISLLLWVAVMAMVAGLYAFVKPFPPPQLPGDFSLVEGEWQFPLCGCFEETNMCCFTFFLCPIRWADNMRMAGIMDFTTAMALSLCGFALTWVWSIAGIIVPLVLVCFRQKLRAKFNIPSDTCCILAHDLCTAVFCGCCMVIQEGRQLEQAYQSGRYFIGRHMGKEGDRKPPEVTS